MNYFAVSCRIGEPAKMTSIFFYLVFLNSLFCLSASSAPSLGVANNDGSAMRDADDYFYWSQINVKDFSFHAIVVTNPDSRNDDSFCSGTIIAKNILITSAYCVCTSGSLNPGYSCNLNNIEAIGIYTGATDNIFTLDKTTKYDVDFVKLNPIDDEAYSKSGQPGVSIKPNIVLIKIKGNFNFDEYTKAINLPDSSLDNDMPKMPMECTVYGFQTRSRLSVFEITTRKNVRIQLYEAKYSLISRMACQQAWSKKSIFVRFDINVCFKPKAPFPICLNGNDTELGTASLVCWNKNDKYIMGIVSETKFCIPNITLFTRIDSQLGLIRQFIEDQKDKNLMSSGDLIHNQMFTQFYGAPLTSVLLLTLHLK